MKHWILYWGLVFSLVVTPILAFAHETTGWIAPGEAKKMKNPVKPTKASIEKGKEIYEKKCALCHGAKGDGKGPAGAGLTPKPPGLDPGSHQIRPRGEMKKAKGPGKGLEL